VPPHPVEKEGAGCCRRRVWFVRIRSRASTQAAGRSSPRTRFANALGGAVVGQAHRRVGAAGVGGARVCAAGCVGACAAVACQRNSLRSLRAHACAASAPAPPQQPGRSLCCDPESVVVSTDTTVTPSRVVLRVSAGLVGGRGRRKVRGPGTASCTHHRRHLHPMRGRGGSRPSDRAAEPGGPPAAPVGPEARPKVRLHASGRARAGGETRHAEVAGGVGVEVVVGALAMALASAGGRGKGLAGGCKQGAPRAKAEARSAAAQPCSAARQKKAVAQRYVAP
jgi:hypothetical protein